MEQTSKNILRDWDISIPSIGAKWMENTISFSMTLEKRSIDVVEKLMNMYDVIYNDIDVGLSRSENGDVLFVPYFLGARFIVDLRVDSDDDKTTTAVISHYRGVEPLKSAAFQEWLKTLGGQLPNHSVSTSMEEVIKGELWLCDDIVSAAKALVVLATQPEGVGAYAKYIFGNTSESGYVLSMDADTFTGRPLYSMMSKREYIQDHADNVQRAVNILNRLEPGTIVL